ncbi:diacylglycerol/lipid kinase family protein [Arthrobacter roseus]|uniref:diacylglycerol/lipid kinase family protein n=1 Tax=Arthrobacter roseus TaxID=136274 RepID=UPI001966498F|nr:diacylglycerol kinase family protein [Arthrobacter roseus]MBM7849742.1 diacylglycerol kinase family enzyme [Arthrobacter roseus]
MTQRAALIVNPIKSTNDDVAKAVRDLSTSEGWDSPLEIETTAEDPGFGQAKEALAAGVDVVLAAGGDGTVRAVAHELAGTDVPLGLIPLGTGNLLARNLELPLNNIADATRRAMLGEDHQIDVVYATLDHADERHLFLVMAGIGFDAAVMADTNDVLKDRVGWLAYVDAGIRNLPGKPSKTRIAINGQAPMRRRLRSVMGGNCGKIQGGLEIFPGAKLDDGVLDIMTVAPSGAFGWIGVAAKLLRRNKGKDPAVEYFQGQSAEIDSEEPLEIQLDGDHLGQARHLAMELDAGVLTIRH